MTTRKTGDLWGDAFPLGQPARRMKVDPLAYKVVSVRLRHGEFESFSMQVQTLGLTHNKALRIAARRIAGFLELDAETRAVLRGVSAEIGEISIALQRLNRTAAMTGSVNMTELASQRAAFARASAVLDDRLQTLLNVSQRRLDGRALLREASAS